MSADPAEARFGPGAARLSGHAALLLGWSPDTFWTATPEELATVLAAFAPVEAGGIDRAGLNAMMERDCDG
ncbi:phage tail assembly chaperone [Novosphingobium sp. EMRT-2]|uniref:phage tail assembly chaperone n=1 Tax=Novosphingobium sp. EMRT-2 TaxID=2571749 RepID=UPI0010BD2AF9|nr:phage tail assembly chaperone [Novosphingobium sp. EMRT-2]QCI93540.1 phage tail assembly chaperone [Novosphingobium sp. EMRT-2]